MISHARSRVLHVRSLPLVSTAAIAGESYAVMMQASLSLAVLAACAAPIAEGPDAAVPPPDAPITDTGRFQRCIDHPFSTAPDEGWRHTGSSLISVASPRHSAADIFAQPGTTPYVGAKLTYGAISKDLEDEDVLAFLDTCNGWRALGRGKTDDDGRVRVKLPELPVGVYEVRFQVAGDQTTTSAFAYVIPAGTHIVVTDIDATLTTSDLELAHSLLDGHIPEMVPDAERLIRAHTDLGHIVMYMTGRPYWQSVPTRAWLALKGFPTGAVRLADSNDAIFPTEGSVGDFKRAKLHELVDAGYLLDVAYGNATTDISAYLDAGLAPDSIWILGDHGGEEGTHAAKDTWATRADEVSASAAIVQPFAY
jgi:hypothetical protein